MSFSLRNTAVIYTKVQLRTVSKVLAKGLFFTKRRAFLTNRHFPLSQAIYSKLVFSRYHTTNPSPFHISITKPPPEPLISHLTVSGGSALKRVTN